jgi:anti-sigma regulatory factor (Ser/Thr protein kinase)
MDAPSFDRRHESGARMAVDEGGRFRPSHGLRRRPILSRRLASVGGVRDRFARCLAAWDLPSEIRDDVLLCTGEFLANAVVAAPGRELRVSVSRDSHRVMLEVWDPSNTMPKAQPVVQLTLDDLDLSEENFDANGGWGLPLVEALALECGYTPHPPDGGKTLWARFKTSRAG